MKAIFLIAKNDLRLFLRDKEHYFWLFGSPLLFAFFMGFAMRGGSGPNNPRPQVVLENHDTGFIGNIFTKELLAQGINISTNADNSAERKLVIPENFTESILAKKPLKLDLTVQGGRAEAKSLVELKLFRTLVAFNGHLVELASATNQFTPETFAQILSKSDSVRLQTDWATRKKIPAGFQQSLPGVMTMFIMMNLLIFGGATLVSERREGVLKRLLVTRLTLTELVLGKIAGLMFLGLVQIALMLTVGVLFMKVQIADNLGLILLTLTIYAWAAGALGILIGSVLSEDKVVAVCVLASMAMAALGGCWWPLEIVPEHVRMLGHVFPTAWHMDALHQLISFGGGFAQITTPLLVLTGFAVTATAFSVRFFKA